MLSFPSVGKLLSRVERVSAMREVGPQVRNKQIVLTTPRALVADHFVRCCLGIMGGADGQSCFLGLILQYQRNFLARPHALRMCALSASGSCLNCHFFALFGIGFLSFLCNYQGKQLNLWLFLSLQLSCAHHFRA